MNNELLDDIILYATQKLNTEYGYCGVTSVPGMVTLKSKCPEGKDIEINIEILSKKR